MEYSKNEIAEKVVGKRHVETNRFTVMFDQPAELGYHCPVCKYERIVDGEFDERMHWSEYNSFLWCSKCDKDYPSALCHTDIDKATETFLHAVLDAKIPVMEENGNLKQWKEDEIKLWMPVIEHMHNDTSFKIGESISEEILKRMINYDELKQKVKDLDYSLTYQCESTLEYKKTNQELIACIKNLVGVFDTPISRRQISGEIADEARQIARNILEKNL